MTDEGAYIIMEKTYKIEVDCANCAATIERHVAKLKCVNEVTVSYMAQKNAIVSTSKPERSIVRMST